VQEHHSILYGPINALLIRLFGEPPVEKLSPGWAYIHTHFGIGYRFDPEPLDGSAAEAPVGRDPAPAGIEAALEPALEPADT